MGTSAPTSSVGFRQQRHELNNGEVREASRADRRGLPARRVLQDDLRLLRESQVVAGQPETDGRNVQNALKEMTGQSTVPNIFIKGKSIGGCDAITSLHAQGKLKPKLEEAGIL